MKKLVTHNGGFHADDVVAYAILQLVLDKRGESYEIIRTRDLEIIKNADIVFDVGGVYDPVVDRYDHHQPDRAGSRENGILYAAAGLVWKHFGRELCENDQVWGDIDKFLIAPIDAVDNGQAIVKEFNFNDVGPGSLSGIIACFNRTSEEDDSSEIIDTVFNQVVKTVKIIIHRYIYSQNHLERLFQELLSIYRNTKDKRIIVANKNIPRPVINRLSEYPEPLFVIYPEKGETGQWSAETVPVFGQNFEPRIPFPEQWAGLAGMSFSQASHISDGIFAHAGRFYIKTESFESVHQLVVQTLEHYQKNS